MNTQKVLWTIRSFSILIQKGLCVLDMKSVAMLYQQESAFYSGLLVIISRTFFLEITTGIEYQMHNGNWTMSKTFFFSFFTMCHIILVQS